MWSPVSTMRRTGKPSASTASAKAWCCDGTHSVSMTVAPSGSSTTPAFGWPGRGVLGQPRVDPGRQQLEHARRTLQTRGCTPSVWQTSELSGRDERIGPLADPAPHEGRPRGLRTDSTEGAPGGKEETKAATTVLLERLAGLQARLWAEHTRSLLVVLQAMDAGGKDGTVKKVFSGVNPMGVHAVAFKAPNDAELAHDFLWRIQRELPERGDIGIFNRSHYEDVLIVRVDELVPEKVWRPRYAAIRAFEEHLADEGTTIVKLFLHISKEEQAERFQARLSDPTKNWKFNVADVDVRKRWDDYQVAYADAIGRTSTEAAPWYVVPADRKWYRDWAVATILVDVLEKMDPLFPEPAPGLSQVKIVGRSPRAAAAPAEAAAARPAAEPAAAARRRHRRDRAGRRWS